SEDISVGGLVWRVNCYPHRYSKEFAPQHLSIYLRLVSESENVKAIFEAFVMDKNGKPSSSSHPWRRGLLVYTPSKEWGWHQFMKGTDIESIYVTDGSVTIVCGVIITHDDDPLDVPPSDMGSHLGRLLNSNDGSDVSFIIKGETFLAHRALLAARSPVFKAQLLGSMADAKMTSITMHDISAATFKAMLRFMYTDTLPADDELGASPLTEVFQDLLAMADRYALDRLKLICARKLWENLSTENVGATLACAETYNCPELKRKCITFVAKDENLKKTVLTDGFLQLVQKYPSIVAEMREKFGE
uniref:BTB domain-containing protein n=1 Tax=Setaria italica TaxID=4555 RepID=K3YMJ1_SETIT